MGNHPLKMRIGVIGAGAWGTTLANLLAEKGYGVALWVYEANLVERLIKERENAPYLPGVRLSERVKPTPSIEEAVKGKDVIIMVTPSHALREVAERAVPFLKGDVRIVIATKGLEVESLKRMSEVMSEVLPSSLVGNLAVLSGPSFAKEVSAKVPTAITVASANGRVAREIQALLSTPHLRVYTSSDVIGVEIGGAVKNVIAIAVGAAVGLGLGYNSQAALITRGLTEMTRLAVKLGANPLTLAGLSGLGDLVLTATGGLSRNRGLGIELGRGRKLEVILRETRTVAEGVRTAKAVYQLAQKLGIEMPISEQVYRMLYENLPPSEALSALMSRELREELEF